MSKIGLFGGTFDPIHNGHLITCMKVCEIRDLDKIIFIPSNVSPLKTNVDSTSANDRLEMVRLAIAHIDYFDYSDYEIKKSDVSYTIDTLKHFITIYDEVELIIGYDNLIVFNKWHKPDEILELVKVVVLKRDTNDEQISHDFVKKVSIVKSPMIDISATDIRNRVRENKPIDFLVPQQVKEYISKNNLYK